MADPVRTVEDILDELADHVDMPGKCNAFVISAVWSDHGFEYKVDTRKTSGTYARKAGKVSKPLKPANEAKVYKKAEALVDTVAKTTA